MPTLPHDLLRDRLVVVLGGGGFLGRHVAQALLARGARLRVASRHVERAYAVKPLGNLGQVQLCRVDVTRPGQLAPVFAGADAVVNLVGAFTGDLDAVQGRGAGAVAAAARAAGARGFVHVSAIGADAASSVGYARSKAEGEAAVLAAFPQATVLRPPVLFGADDNFITMFAGLMAFVCGLPLPPVLPVFVPSARLQPLLVDDAAEAIAVALAEPSAHGGRRFEIAGPEVITMLDLNRRIAAAARRRPLLVPLPDALSALIAALPGTPISIAQVKLLQAGSVASGALPGLAELGIRPRPLGLFLDDWLVRFRANGRFAVAEPAR